MLTEVSRISEVIITPEYNEEGIYTVRFCIQVMALTMGFIFLFFFLFCVERRKVRRGLD